MLPFKIKQCLFLKTYTFQDLDIMSYMTKNLKNVIYLYFTLMIHHFKNKIFLIK